MAWLAHQRRALGAFSSARLKPLKTIISTRIGGNMALQFGETATHQLASRKCKSSRVKSSHTATHQLASRKSSACAPCGTAHEQRDREQGSRVESSQVESSQVIQRRVGARCDGAEEQTQVNSSQVKSSQVIQRCIGARCDGAEEQPERARREPLEHEGEYEPAIYGTARVQHGA
jgi:hypothetical protein